MRAHGAAVKAYREVGKHEIGLVVNIEPKYPATRLAPTMPAADAARARLHESSSTCIRHCSAITRRS